MLSCFHADMQVFAKHVRLDARGVVVAQRVAALSRKRFDYTCNQNLSASSDCLTKVEIEIASQGDSFQIADSIWTVIIGAMIGMKILHASRFGNSANIAAETTKLIRCMAFTLNDGKLSVKHTNEALTRLKGLNVIDECWET